MSKRKTFCPTCGQATDARRITMGRQQLAGLRFAASYDPEPMPLHALGRHFGGTNSTVYQAFYTLRYFGLVTRPTGPDGKEVVGQWVLTDLGRWFLADWEDVPRWVEVFDNRVVVISEDKVGVNSIPTIKVDYDYAVAQMRPASDVEVSENADRRTS